MIRKASIDLRNLLKQQDFAMPKGSSEGCGSDDDKPALERELPELKQDDGGDVREAPPKHLPRPTRR